MEIKRYDMTGCRSTKCSSNMVEFEDGDYVLWDDLIAAGVLVPVPDGEACRLDEYGLRYFVHESEPRPCVRIHSINDDSQWLIEKLGEMQRSWWHASTIVQPVRLVRLEDVG